MPLYVGSRYSLLGSGGAAAAAAPPPPLDGLSDLTGAYSFSRDLLTSFIGNARYADSSGAITSLEDQSGNNRDFTDGAQVARRPALVSTGPNNRAAAQFDGSSDFLTSSVTITNFITNTTAYLILSGRADNITTADATVQNNDAIILDSNACMGAFLHSTTPSLKGMHHDGGGTRDQTDHAIAVGTVFVVELRHEGGNFSSRLNGGSWSTVASGNTLAVNGNWWLGRTTGLFSEVTVFELAIFNVVPNDTQKDALAADLKTWIGAV